MTFVRSKGSTSLRFMHRDQGRRGISFRRQCNLLVFVPFIIVLSIELRHSAIACFHIYSHNMTIIF